MKANLSKADEVELLRQFSASLPNDSYLRDWLNFALPAIEQDIRNDVFPTIVPAEARAESEEILKRARNKAEQITEEARVAAAQIVADAESKCARRQSTFEHHLRKAVQGAHNFVRGANEVLS